ncbi:MAG: polymerase sigma factor (sigma70) [Rhodospirillales bacterium]|nr:polymerase sigma factor (sigma70) [Rhodospirillales bacterium]
MAETNSAPLLTLLVTYYDELTAYLARRLGSVSTAQDVLQDTYVRLRGVAAETEIDNPRAYIFRVASNLALDRLRADGRTTRLFTGLDDSKDYRCDLPNAEVTLDHKQRFLLLAKAVDELPPKRRRVFLMHKFDGLTHAEIAADLGITKSAVEKHVMKALAHCRDRLLT